MLDNYQDLFDDYLKRTAITEGNAENSYDRSIH